MNDWCGSLGPWGISWWGCCADPCACPCYSCKNNCAACCYQIEIEDEVSLVTWDGECSWSEKPDGGATTMSMSISGTALTVTTSDGTFSATIPADADCLNFSSLAVSEDGGDRTAYVTADGSNCYGCDCYCAECAETSTGKNAPCCWMVEIGGEYYYLTRDSEEEGYSGGCVWSDTDCDIGDIVLTIESNAATLTFNEQTWSDDFSPNKPQCCGGLTLYNETGGSITLLGLSATTCDLRKYECVQLTVAGVEKSCGCWSCIELNDTFSLTWTGNRYEGPLCNSGNPYWKCQESTGLDTYGWDYAVALVSETGNGGTATVYLYAMWNGSPAKTAKFTGSIAPGDDSGQYVLSLDSTNATDCDFSGATITLTMGPECAPCGDSQTCEERLEQVCLCHEMVYPEYYEVVIPGNGILGDWGDNLPGTYLIPAGQCGGSLNVSDGSCDTPEYISIGHSAAPSSQTWYITIWMNDWTAYCGPGCWVGRDHYLKFAIGGVFDPCDWGWTFDCYLLGQTWSVYMYDWDADCGGDYDSDGMYRPWKIDVPIQLRAV